MELGGSWQGTGALCVLPVPLPAVCPDAGTGHPRQPPASARGSQGLPGVNSVAELGTHGGWVAAELLWALTVSLLPQDYTDALLTNYCVSAGGSRRRSAPLCPGAMPAVPSAGAARLEPSAPLSLSPASGAAVGLVGRPERLGMGWGCQQGPFTAVSFSTQIWPPVQIANFYFVPLKHR